MFCKYCGNTIDDDTVFCPHCGKQLTAAPNSEGASDDGTYRIKFQNSGSSSNANYQNGGPSFNANYQNGGPSSSENYQNGGSSYSANYQDTGSGNYDSAGRTASQATNGTRERQSAGSSGGSGYAQGSRETNSSSGGHGYIAKSLNPGEVVRMQAHVHIWHVMGWIVLAVICLIVAIVVMATLGATGILFLVLTVIFALVAFVRFRSTELGFTNKRVIGKTGFVNTNSLDAPLAKINDVSFSNGAAGKMFGFGDLVIKTASGQKFDFKGISHANEFRNALMQEIEQYEESKIQRAAEANAEAMGRYYR